MVKRVIAEITIRERYRITWCIARITSYFYTPYTVCVLSHICHILKLVDQYYLNSNNNINKKKKSIISWVNKQTRCKLTTKKKKHWKIYHSNDNWNSILYGALFCFHFYSTDFEIFGIANFYTRNCNTFFIWMNSCMHRPLFTIFVSHPLDFFVLVLYPRTYIPY